MSRAQGLAYWADSPDGREMAEVWNDLTGADVGRVKTFKYPIPYGDDRDPRNGRDREWLTFINETARRFERMEE